jgi:hypothetical protein
VKCIAGKSEITLNQTTFVEWHGLRDLAQLGWGKLSSQRTEGIFFDLRTYRSENHDMRPRATNVDGGCYIVMSACWNTFRVSKRIRIGNKGDLAPKIPLRYVQQTQA